MASHKIFSLLSASLLISFGGMRAHGQTQEQPQTQAPKPSPPRLMVDAPNKGTKISGTLSDVFMQIKKQDPIRRAGMRATLLRRAQLIVPIVVIVEDADSYLYAISNWEAMVRFPVLWDDGTQNSREDIARFVRAFKPKQILRLRAHLDAPDSSWVGSRDQKQALFDTVLSKAVDESVGDWQEAFDGLAERDIVSPGMVVTDVADSSWTAALALCAGRLQPVAFVIKPSSPAYKPMSMLDADGLERSIERAARLSGRSWETIGDDIDAITLAINTGTMIKEGKLSLTDRLGRKEAGGTGKRWAWCGQIIGNESRCVYQAMSSLFLSLDQAFVWDGYANKQPWAQYDGSEAARVLKEAKLQVEIHDQPNYTLNKWKLRMVRPIGEVGSEDESKDEGSALLMLMNSKGASNVFDLPGAVDGSGKPGHLPMMNVPTALHIVHSYSLQRPINRNTVGGRFIERGVFVYAGSVDEPYLNAFVPTPSIARRLVGSLPFAAAIHFDDNKVWKITVLGDPLVTLGKAGQRIGGKIDVSGAIDLEQQYKQRLKDKDYLGAMQDMALLGKDTDVARIAIALMSEKPEDFGHKMALVAIPSLFRVGEYTRMVDAYERLDALGQSDALMQDFLWLASPYLLARTAGDRVERSRIEALLRANIRKWQSIQDAESLAMAMRSYSIENAIGVLEALRPTLNENQSKMLDRAIRRVRK